MEQQLANRTDPEAGAHPKTSESLDRGKARHAITIRKPLEDVYHFWRSFENLAKFMKGIRQVTTLSPTRSHWEVELESGRDVVWDAEIVAEEPGRMISWKTVDGSEVNTSGTVWFERATGNRGTVVRLSMDYEVPGGKIGEWIAFFNGEDPSTLALTNLKRLKCLLETGEIATTDGQSTGRASEHGGKTQKNLHHSLHH